jgi:hypothetical protein
MSCPISSRHAELAVLVESQSDSLAISLTPIGDFFLANQRDLFKFYCY